MPQQSYDTSTPRIGKAKGEILAHSLPHEVLGITGENKKMQKNNSDTIVFRRWLPYGGATTNSTTINQWVVDENAHLTQEGVTPDADTLTPQDITVQINQYSCLYMYTDKTADLYEDDIPSAMKEQVGERMGLVREMVRYGALKACSNKYYAGGTSRATVDETIGNTLLSKVSQNLLGNYARQITMVLDASPNYNTAPIEAAFLVFCHTDMEYDIRQLPNFIHVAEYGSRKVVHENELGSSGRFRFVISPDLKSIPDSGAAIGSTGLYSTTGSNIDVYPIIVTGKKAWGDIALRGMDSFDVVHHSHKEKSKADLLGQRGYVGSIFWDAAKVLNDGWMAVIEAGRTSL